MALLVQVGPESMQLVRGRRNHVKRYSLHVSIGLFIIRYPFTWPDGMLDPYWVSKSGFLIGFRHFTDQGNGTPGSRQRQESPSLRPVRPPLAGTTDREVFDIAISGFRVEAFSGLMGLMGALAIFKWVRSRCARAMPLDLHKLPHAVLSGIIAAG